MPTPMLDRYCEPGEEPGLAHCLTVAKLRELLDELEPTDVVWVNRVRNLSIERDGEYIGLIDLLYVDPSVLMHSKFRKKSRAKKGGKP